VQNFIKPQYPPLAQARANRHSEKRKFHYLINAKHINERRADVFVFRLSPLALALSIARYENETQNRTSFPT